VLGCRFCLFLRFLNLNLEYTDTTKAIKSTYTSKLFLNDSNIINKGHRSRDRMIVVGLNLVHGEAIQPHVIKMAVTCGRSVHYFEYSSANEIVATI
jgi:hypothetical protein